MLELILFIVIFLCDVTNINSFHHHHPFHHFNSKGGTDSCTTIIQSSDDIIRLYNTDPRKPPADNDFISSFFSKFLPTPEDIGLSRYNSTTRPENYPCTKTEFALPLPDDIKSKDQDLLLIRQLLAKTNLEFRNLQCLYDANKDGWKAKIFHEKVDKKGTI
jgi:hypothetical protein